MPAVQVQMMSLPEPRGDRGTSPPPSSEPRKSASITAIEQAIAHAAPLERLDPQPPAPTPRYLDLDPAEGLSPRAARLDRLIRSVLRDPRWPRGAALDEVAARAAARQTPAASPGLVREALARMTSWPDSPVFRSLRAADPSTIQYDLAFTLPCPLADEPSTPTVVHGTCDMVYLDSQGRWQVLVVADARACPARQRLRLQLAGLAAEARGFAPVRQGWLIRHGPGAEMEQETETVFDAATAARLLAGLVRAVC
jgi:hypothetical protein